MGDPKDPKRMFIEAVARLGRETQFHIDERYHHFYINKVVIVTILALLLVVAVVNVYLVRILYNDLTGIVGNMDSMRHNMQLVSGRMSHITDNIHAFEKHMRHMDHIYAHTGAMAELMPDIEVDMQDIADSIDSIESDMLGMSRGMNYINVRFTAMTQGVAVMRTNMRQISRPMGAMNPFLP